MVLVVDDEPVIIELLRTYLTGLGYEVATAMNGADALGIVESRRPDAVLLDLNLPDVQGDRILAHLRAMDDTIAVLMLTGNTDEDIARGLLGAGALDYICKPVRLEVLETAVATAVSFGRRDSVTAC